MYVLNIYFCLIISEREPFPSVRERIVKQREKEKQMRESQASKRSLGSSPSKEHAVDDSSPSTAIVISIYFCT